MFVVDVDRAEQVEVPALELLDHYGSLMEIALRINAVTIDLLREDPVEWAGQQP